MTLPLFFADMTDVFLDGFIPVGAVLTDEVLAVFALHLQCDTNHNEIMGHSSVTVYDRFTLCTVQ